MYEISAIFKSNRLTCWRGDHGFAVEEIEHLVSSTVVAVVDVIVTVESIALTTEVVRRLPKISER